MLNILDSPDPRLAYDIYMVLGVYSIPLTITITAYVHVVKLMQESSLRNQQRRKTTIIQDVMVLQCIVILIGILIVLILPSAFFGFRI